jgi:hypothetical protein
MRSVTWRRMRSSVGSGWSSCSFDRSAAVARGFLADIARDVAPAHLVLPPG